MTSNLTQKNSLRPPGGEGSVGPNASADFLAILALLFYRTRNSAIGIKDDTDFIRGLSSYALVMAQSKAREGLAEIAQASFHRSIIQQARKNVGELVIEAEKQETTTEERRSILSEAIWWEQRAEEAGKLLADIATGRSGYTE